MNILFGASYSLAAVPPGVTCLATLVQMKIVSACCVQIHTAVCVFVNMRLVAVLGF